MSTQFEWIDAYTKIATALLPYKTKQKELLHFIYAMFNEMGITNNYLQDKQTGTGVNFEKIDPFTVMGIFNRNNTTANRMAIINHFFSFLKIDAEAPTNFDGIPVLNGMLSWFFGGKEYDRSTHIDKLWELFETGIKLADTPSAETETQFVKLFDFVISRPCSKWMTTMGLFWIRPYRFIPLDGNTRAYLNNNLSMGYKFNKIPSGRSYLDMCADIKTILSENGDISSFPALSQAAWTEKNDVSLEKNFRAWMSKQQSTTGELYTPGAVGNNAKALREACKGLLDLQLEQDNLFYCSDATEFADLVEKIRASAYFKDVEDKKRHNGFLSSGMKLYERFLLECEAGTVTQSVMPSALALTEVAPLVSPTVQYWAYAPGPASSMWGEFYSSGIMCIGWDEIGDLNAFQDKNAIKLKLNKIYHNDNSYINDSLALFEFATKMQIGDIVYAKRGRKWIVGRGIVKSDYLYDQTRDVYKHVRKVEWTHSGEWKLDEQIAVKTLTDFTPYEDLCLEIEALICGDKAVSAAEYTKADFLKEVYMTPEKYDDISALLERKKNIILQGAPGVGKSFLAKRLAYSIIGSKDSSKVEMVQFHQSYSYEDFIEGFRPAENGHFEVRQGVFYRFCQRAKNDKENKYFFIIDEINRGNLSKIMGELMLLIEQDKRGSEYAMPLTYSGERFYVPENIYVIGMMNTADRSLAMIDYALRRRFSFVPIEPAFENERFIADFGANYANADTVIEKMKKLNSLIKAELDEGHQIGHSYFCSDKPLAQSDIDGIFKYEISELLREYFFDNESKLDEALKML